MKESIKNSSVLIDNSHMSLSDLLMETFGFHPLRSDVENIKPPIINVTNGYEPTTNSFMSVTQRSKWVCLPERAMMLLHGKTGFFN